MMSATRGGHQFRQENRSEEYQRSYHKQVAEQLDQLIHSGEFDRVVLGGAEKEAHGVFRELHQTTAEAVAGIAPIPIDARDDDVLAASRPLVDELEASLEEAAVRRALRRWNTSGAGTVGVAPTVAALERGAVRRLLLGAQMLPSEVREDLVRQALRAGADVLFVFGPAKELLAEHEGVAAELYFNPFASRARAAQTS